MEEKSTFSERQRVEQKVRKLLKDQTDASKERGNPKSKVLLNRKDIPQNYIVIMMGIVIKIVMIIHLASLEHYHRIAPHLSWGEWLYLHLHL